MDFGDKKGFGIFRKTPFTTKERSTLHTLKTRTPLDIIKGGSMYYYGEPYWIWTNDPLPVKQVLSRWANGSY